MFGCPIIDKDDVEIGCKGTNFILYNEKKCEKFDGGAGRVECGVWSVERGGLRVER